MKLLLILSSLILFIQANDMCYSEQPKIFSNNVAEIRPQQAGCSIIQTGTHLIIKYECLDKQSQTALVLNQYQDIYDDINIEKTYTSRSDQKTTEEESTESLDKLISKSFIEHLFSEPIIEKKVIIKEEAPIVVVKTIKPFINELPTHPYKKREPIPLSTNKTRKNNSNFLAISYNKDIFDVTSSVNNIATSGYSFELESGYYMSTNIFTTLTYQRIILNDISIHNFSTSINYEFDATYGFKPFLGLTLGYGFLAWEDGVFDTAGTQNVTASGISTGLKIGLVKEFTESFSYYLLYKYTLTDFKTALVNSTNTSSVNVNHNSIHSLGLGIRYNF